MKLDSVRHEYNFLALTKRNVDENPFKQFEQWLNEALHSAVKESTAMALSTIGLDGFPQSRIVLLKSFDEQGFVFFTNYKSAKGKSIEKIPEVGLHFFWPELERQIRISGIAEKTSAEVSDNYFHSRPLNSQIGAVISDQSTEIPSREFLEKRFEELSSELKNQLPKRPEWWGGYCVKPIKIEFWQGRENRLHDRILYEKQNENWIIKRLAP
ncbi:MAG TPA: pyridoxamine 5'-phosphate oxidase [Draconibacterium sp.]|nr:pyridoxamine 5'-phosphate oxidase [Draconibacterium sp.]